MSTAPEIHLSPTLRAAQRAVAAWLDRGSTDARNAAFTARTALALLDPTDHARLTRWLAWICMAGGSQGSQTAQTRIQRLDPRLGMRIAAEMQRLPNLSAPFTRRLLRSA